MNGEMLIKTYGLSSIAILELLEELRADLEPATRRSQNSLQVYMFFASG